MSRKKRHQGDKVEAILLAARDMFATNGFEHTSISRIADSAQVAGGTVIYHFKTKENLHFILCRQIIYNIFRTLRHEVRQANSPADAVEAFILGYQHFVEENSLDYLVLLQADPFLILDVTQPAFIDLKIFQHWILLLLQDSLEYGIELGELSPLPVAQTSQLIVSMLHAASRAQLLSNGDGPLLFPEVLHFVKARLAFANTSGKCEEKRNPT